MLCFLVLMQNGKGLIDKSPDYITEKTHILGRGLDAFAALDIHNMSVVVEWCGEWGVAVPEKVLEEYNSQRWAFEELKAKGFEL